MTIATPSRRHALCAHFKLYQVDRTKSNHDIDLIDEFLGHDCCPQSGLDLPFHGRNDTLTINRDEFLETTPMRCTVFLRYGSPGLPFRFLFRSPADMTM
jgi:hypothetical protein